MEPFCSTEILRTHPQKQQREKYSGTLPKITVKCCRTIEDFAQDGWARLCPYRASGCPSAPLSSPHSLNACERLAPVLGVCAWPGELGDTYALSQMGFLKTYKVHMHVISTQFSTYNKFIRSRAHFPRWLWFGSPSCVLVCRHPESDGGTALFEPLASEKVIYLRHEI